MTRDKLRVDAKRDETLRHVSPQGKVTEYRLTISLNGVGVVKIREYQE